MVFSQVTRLVKFSRQNVIERGLPARPQKQSPFDSHPNGKCERKAGPRFDATEYLLLAVQNALSDKNIAPDKSNLSSLINMLRYASTWLNRYGPRGTVELF